MSPLARILDDLDRKGLRHKEQELRSAIESELSNSRLNIQRLEHMREELDYVTLRLYRNHKKVIPRYVQGGGPETGKRR